MKKIIGALGVVIIAMAMFFNTDYQIKANDFNLISLKMAMAQDGGYENGDGASGVLGEAVLHNICHTVTIGGGVVPGSYTYEDCYDEWQCDGWWGWCY